MTTTVIMPSKIAEGDAQNVTADLTKFDVAKNMVALVVVELKKCVSITTKTELDNALQTAKDANEILKAIEEKRKVLVKPFNDSVGVINVYAKKDLSFEVQELIATIKTNALAFQKAEEKKELEAKIVVREKVLVDLGFTYDSAKDVYSLDGIGTVSNNEVKNYDDRTFKTITDSFSQKILEASKKENEKLVEGADLIEAFGSSEDKAKLQTATAPVSAPVTYVPPVTGIPVGALKGLTKKWVFEVTDETLVPREYLTVEDKLVKAAITAGVREIPGIRIYQDESITLR